MSYQEIVKMFNKIETVSLVGYTVGVNNSVIFTYKHKEVAKEVAKKLENFIGV